jgi:hypothetical protein
MSTFMVRDHHGDPNGAQHELAIVLENMHPESFEHFDLWLKKRLKNNLPAAIHLCKPLAGYGHRMSLTSRQGPVFGGAWLPSQYVGQNTDVAAFEGSPMETGF